MIPGGGEPPPPPRPPRAVIEELDAADRRRRPAAVRPVTFEALAAPGPRPRVDGLALVPAESVRAGDEQVFAARLPRRAGEPEVDLGPLVGYPTVRSVVASTTVAARRPLPQIAELLLLDRTLVPDERTLASLPGLERLWAGWAPGDRRLAAGALPAERLRELGIHRAALPEGPAELAPLTGLRRLVLDGCWPRDSVAPLAGMAGLVRLRADAPGGWPALRGLAALEEVVAIEPRLANLGALRGWTRLRDLTLTGRGVGALAGIEAFAALERLRLTAARKIADLSPLAGLPRLAEIELSGLDRLRDLAPLGRLPALRRLVIARLGRAARDTVHLATLRPLAGARALEELVLRGAMVDDGDLAPLADLPALRRLEVFGDLGTAVSALRRARPDVEVIWREGGKPAGLQAGPVVLHPPDARIAVWWLREDLTDLLGASTNADAEERLRQELAARDPALLARLRFDTEAEAVTVEADREEDLRAVAGVLEELGRSAAAG